MHSPDYQVDLNLQIYPVGIIPSKNCKILSLSTAEQLWHRIRRFAGMGNP